MSLIDPSSDAILMTVVGSACDYIQAQKGPVEDRIDDLSDYFDATLKRSAIAKDAREIVAAQCAMVGLAVVAAELGRRGVTTGIKLKWGFPE